jgi:hypothetical protein
VSPSVVSSALVQEESEIQKPVYFTSRALHWAEERYPRIEKLAFALITLAQKLRPYFQAYVVQVLTKYLYFQNYFSDKEKVARSDSQGSCPDARARDSVLT